MLSSILPFPTNISFRYSPSIFSLWSFIILTYLFHQFLLTSAQPTITQLSAPSTSPKPKPSKHDQHFAYIIILRGKDFGDDPHQLHVSINGVPATDVILHNTTAFSFRIPDHIVDNPQLLQSSYLKITVGTIHRKTIPLIVLHDIIAKVDMSSFRREIEQRNSDHSTDNSDSSKTDDKSNQKHEQEQEQIITEPPHITQLLHEADSLLKISTKQSTTEKAIDLLEKAVSENSPRAMTILATIFLGANLPGIKRDIPKAVQYLQTASNQGFPDAQALMGFLYASGIAGTALRKDIGAAILMWTFAAEGGSMYARMALGYRYLTGTDIHEDCEKASKYYKSVADEVYSDTRKTIYKQLNGRKSKTDISDDTIPDILPPIPTVILHSDRKRLKEGMVRHVRGESNEIVQYYRHMADRGDPQAQVVMGNLHYYGGNDMPQDLIQARYRYEQAAKNGRSEANAHLGFMDLGSGRNESAVRFLKKASAEGDKLGLLGMGYVTLYGIGVDRDAREAVKFFTRSAENDHPEAMYNLAIMYSKGIGVTQSSHDSFRMFQAAAHSGHLQSNYILGVMMLEGMGPAGNECAIATKHLKFVSQEGSWNKILSLAFRAYEASSFADALYRYLQAGHAGIELAQYNAGFMYEHNTIKNHDGFSLQSFDMKYDEKRNGNWEREAIVEEALELFQMSASQGHSHSMVRIGDLEFGESLDYSKAAKAYEKAYKLGDSEAMFNLGWMYARGLGKNVDKHMAKRYFDLAKETNREAIMPATIAVLGLKYSDDLHELIDKIWKLYSKIEESNLEAIVLTILMGVLIMVIIMRQRRIQNNNNEEE